MTLEMNTARSTCQTSGGIWAEPVSTDIGGDQGGEIATSQIPFIRVFSYDWKKRPRTRYSNWNLEARRVSCRNLTATTETCA